MIELYKIFAGKYDNNTTENWQLTPIPDPNRPTTWGPDPNLNPNRPSGRGIIWKLALTRISDPNRY